MNKKCNGWRLPRIPAILLTFFFVNIFWVFFRATTLTRAWDVVGSMLNICHIAGTTKEFRRVMASFDMPKNLLFGIFIGAAVSAFFLPNSARWQEIFKKYPYCRVIVTAVFFFVGFICLSRKSPFLYFNF